MSLRALSGLLELAPQYQRILKSLRNPRANATVQVLSNAVPFALASLWHQLRVPALVITPRSEDARRLHEQVTIWSDEGASILHFPETEALPFERLVSDIDTTHQRLRTLSALTEAGDHPPMVITSAVATAQKTIDRRAFGASCDRLTKHQVIDLDELLDRWRTMGYRFESAVDMPGLASRRGGIVDIYPINSAMPARIELWGNEIDSIRLFDPATQRSTDVVESVDIIPAQEVLPALTNRSRLDELMADIDFSNCTDAARERIEHEFGLLQDGYELEDANFYSGLFSHGSLLDYFPRDGLLVMVQPPEIAEAAWATEERIHELRRVKEQRGELPANFPVAHLAWNEVEEQTTAIKRRMYIVPWGANDLVQQDIQVLPFASPPTFMGKLDGFVEEASELARERHRVIAVTSH